MAKKVLISGYYGYDNFGDEAILSVLIDRLNRFGADITVLSKSPLKTARTYGVKSVKNFDLLLLMAAISSCDVLISGGGSLLQDITSFKSLLYYCFVIWFACVCKKPVIIFAQGIGPLQRDISKRMVFNLLARCALVTVRDLKSQQYLKENGIDAQLVSDPVFSVDLPINEKEGIVGVQLRAFKSIDDAFLFSLAQQIVNRYSDRKIELYAFQESLDYDICKKFDKMLKTIAPRMMTEIVKFTSQSDIIVRISKLEYMVAMRFHAVLVAIKTGVKTLAINYDAKVEKLAYEAFLPLLTLSIEEDFDAPFDRMEQLNPDDLLEFSRSQNFEWNLYDSFFA